MVGLPVVAKLIAQLHVFIVRAPPPLTAVT